ncbi:MAG: hypothetical protein VXZ82_24865 [Planctomycetota bacterium]|nr:hypothetical protein [Planctomycetota bacterium]
MDFDARDCHGWFGVEQLKQRFESSLIDTGGVGFSWLDLREERLVNEPK